MTYVLLVQRPTRDVPSVYVEQGSTPWLVPDGCRRGVKLYTQGRAFELVYGGNYRARKALSDTAADLWEDESTLVQTARTRDDGATVQVHAVL